MSEKSGKSKSKGKNIVKDYVLSTVIFLVIALAVTVAVIFAAMKPVTSLVHEAENAASISVGDVQVKPAKEMTAFDYDTTEYGTYVARIVCEDRGLDTAVYRGLNRASTRCGAGLSGKGAFFTDDDTAIAAGCDETYFSALKYVEKGDVITVFTADTVVKYKVSDAYYDTDDTDFDSLQGDLVLYSVFSEFSDNAGKCYYVFADKISQEGN
ncbi:MAG: hypothetical protein PUE08_06655 [Eubacteriales bacterium]|nr:hypothetical protein [Eubacteriales bacterium]